MKKMENKLEFEHEKRGRFEKWRLVYYKAKKVPCSDKEKAIYGVDYKYEKAPEEYTIIVHKDILIDLKQEIYCITSWADSYSLKGERIFSFSNLENAKRVAMFMAKCDLIDFEPSSGLIDLYFRKKIEDFDSYMTAKEKELEEYENNGK